MSRSMIVVVSGSPYDGMRRSARGLTDALAADFDVLFVDPPRSPVTHLRGGGRAAGLAPSLRTVSNGVSVLTPVVLPGKDRRMVRSSTPRIMRRQVRSALNALGVSPLAVIQQPPHYSVLGELDERLAIYHASDDFSAGSDLMGLDTAHLVQSERRTAGRADVVLAVSEQLVEKWRAICPSTVLFPNGVDTDAFGDLPSAPDVPVRKLTRPVVGVVGTLSERLDLDVLELIADAGISVRLIGPSNFRHQAERFAALVARPGVDWVGEVAFEQLPSLYGTVDIGLVPYTLSTFNLGSSPLKALEYLAAGKPVVSADLPSIRSLALGDVLFAGTVDDYLPAITEAASMASTPDAVQARRNSVAAHSWNARAGQLAALIDERVSER